MNQAAPRKRWKDVDGVLLLDKPRGLSSNDALQKARRLFSAAKGGHTGTLDPMATGLLPLCFGEATKFSNRLLDADKTYEATLLLGVVTTTGDAEGEILRERPVEASEEQIREVAGKFLGALQQLPPMYSALKHQGKALYEYARQGIEIERELRSVVIHSLDILRIEGAEVDIRVRCSKGTYIRTLAEDIGETLGCGAHLIALRRTAISNLDVCNAITLEGIAEIVEESRAGLLQAPDSLLSHLPEVTLAGDQARFFLYGQPVCVKTAPGEVRVYGEGRFLGLGLSEPPALIKPVRLIATKSP
jgi:tRNA pseudouridine55 synthase